MKPVAREEILDYQTYSEQRQRIREEAMAHKKPRRIHVGDHLTFLFENRVTVRYQVQEMMRAEQLVKETDIRHEIDTFNELLGGEGELGCTLLIEIETPEERDRLLKLWLGLPSHLYAALEDGTKVRASFDKRQVGDERLSSVQYLKFDTGGKVPVALGCDLPELTITAKLDETQRAALAEDLGQN